MKMKKRCFTVVLCLLCFHVLPVSAAQGTLYMQLPDELRGKEVHYEIDGEPACATVDDDGILQVEGLEPDTYDVKIQDTEEFAFMDMEIPVPLWDEEEQKMQYEISITPKYSRKAVPETGDTAETMVYVMTGVASLTVMVGAMLLRKRRSI